MQRLLSLQWRCRSSSLDLSLNCATSATPLLRLTSAVLVVSRVIIMRCNCCLFVLFVGDNTVKVWNRLVSGSSDGISYNLLTSLEGHSSYVLAVAMSADCSTIISGSSKTNKQH